MIPSASMVSLADSCFFVISIDFVANSISDAVSSHVFCGIFLYSLFFDCFFLSRDMRLN